MPNNAIAHQLAEQQRDIGVAEFFSRNRHLLGFDNKRKALMTSIKEAVDNALDACEEAKVLPEVLVDVIDMGNDRFRVIVEDNGPGIVKKQIPKIFAKLLYGSKFHTLKQSRGQQGIGISASVLYGQLTTGKAASITSKIHPKEPALHYKLRIDTKQNKPEIVEETEVEWKKEQGTKVQIDLEASYIGGSQSIDEYLKETAIVNPHVTIIYTNPKAEQIVFPRAVKHLPKDPKAIKPHPYGVELGNLMTMLANTPARTLQSFLISEFSRVGSGTAKHVCENAALLPSTRPKSLNREQVEQLMKGIAATKLVNPPTDCISPITARDLEKGLRKEVNAEFYYAVTRPPAVYRGNPFLIEAAVAYGGEQPSDQSIKLNRFANRVPLLYQQSACAMTRSVLSTVWRNYGISQSRGALPVGPVTLIVHICSVWVPFTSESKEAIAHYPEIIKEVRLALQECGRRLGSYVNKKKRVHAESQKRDYIETYIPFVSNALKEMLKLSQKDEDKTRKLLRQILEKTRGKLENLHFDPGKNVDYDEDLAKIGKDGKKDKPSA
jgi:DNA topoisomerase-6 subunit B